MEDYVWPKIISTSWKVWPSTKVLANSWSFTSLDVQRRMLWLRRPPGLASRNFNTKAPFSCDLVGAAEPSQGNAMPDTFRFTWVAKTAFLWQIDSICVQHNSPIKRQIRALLGARVLERRIGQSMVFLVYVFVYRFLVYLSYEDAGKALEKRLIRCAATAIAVRKRVYKTRRRLLIRLLGNFELAC